MGLLDFIFRRDTPSSVPPVLPGTPAAAPGPRASDASLTRAERKFLGQFIAGLVFDPRQGTHWDEVLSLPRAKLIGRFVADGLVEPADLGTKINGRFTGAELKLLLKERGLAVSGRKDACIARLIAADREGSAALVRGIDAYVCTPSGKQIAEEFAAAEKQEAGRARATSLERLRDKDLSGALKAVYQFERRQVFSRGVGCDWFRDPSPEETARVRYVLEARPQILKDVAEGDWPVLQIAAAMMQLWGESKGSEWLPADCIGASNLDREVAVRMVMFAGLTRADLTQYAHAGIKQVEVLDCGDSSCPACRKLAKRKYRVSQAPVLRCPECTSPMGCRCTFVTVM